MKPAYLAIVPLLLLASPAKADKDDWAKISDIGAYSLMAVSIGLPLAQGDKKGAIQAGGSLAATSLITEGLKQAFPKTRPDLSDLKSFPSGHTSRSFSSAATLYNRQGPKVGIPAFAVAALVGTARVKADKHYWSDVLVGAAIGTGSGLLLTRKRATNSEFMPWADTKGGGFSYALRF